MIVEQIVARLHVGTSDLEVLRYVRSRMSKEARTSRDMQDARKQAYRQAIACHRANQDEYAWVMGGHS